jgi:hypothetical protein
MRSYDMHVYQVRFEDRRGDYDQFVTVLAYTREDAVESAQRWWRDYLGQEGKPPKIICIIGQGVAVVDHRVLEGERSGQSVIGSDQTLTA